MTIAEKRNQIIAMLFQNMDDQHSARETLTLINELVDLHIPEESDTAWFSRTYNTDRVSCSIMLNHCVINAKATREEVHEACRLIIQHTQLHPESETTLRGHLLCIQHFTREGMTAKKAAEIVITVLNSVIP